MQWEHGFSYMAMWERRRFDSSLSITNGTKLALQIGRTTVGQREEHRMIAANLYHEIAYITYRRDNSPTSQPT